MSALIKLQVALDFTNLNTAIRIAEDVNKYIDIIEVGTPLIKSEGIKTVKIIKKRFPNKEVVADMKIMDTGYMEARLAFENLADYVTVLAVASDETLKQVVKAASEYNKGVMVDFISVRNATERMKDIIKYNPDYVLIHSGIDEQSKGIYPFELFDRIKSRFRNIKIGIVGGVNALNIKKIKNLPDLVIVGSFITKSRNPQDAAKKMREVLWKL